MPGVYAFLSEVGAVFAALFLVTNNLPGFLAGLFFSILFVSFQKKTVIKIATILLVIFVFLISYAKILKISAGSIPEQYLNKKITFTAKAGDLSAQTFKPDTFKVTQITIDGKTYYTNCKVYARWQVPPPYSIVKIQGEIKGENKPGIIDKINRTEFVAYADSVTVLKKNKVFDALLRIRKRITENTALSMKSNEAFLLLSSTAGISTLAYQEKTPFYKTGTAHIFAVSGLHTSILGESTQKMFSFTGNSAPDISLIVLFIFLLIVGFRVSALRALGMYGISVIATKRGEEEIPINTLAVTAILVTVFNPTVLFKISFIFSFSAVFAILIVAPLLSNSLPKNTICKTVAQVVSVQLLLFPLIAYYFHTLSISAFLTNLIVIPYMYIALPVGLIQSVLSAISLQAAKVFAPISNFVFHILYAITLFFSKMPASSLNIKFNTLNLVEYFAAFGLLIFALKSKKKYLQIIASALIVIVIVVPLISKPQFAIYPLNLKGEDGFIVQKKNTVIYITSPTILSSESSDLYEIQSALRKQGINRITLMVFDSPMKEKESSSTKLIGIMPIKHIMLVKGQTDLTDAFTRTNSNMSDIKVVSQNSVISINGIKVTVIPQGCVHTVLIENKQRKYLLVGKFAQPLRNLPYADIVFIPEGSAVKEITFGKVIKY